MPTKPPPPVLTGGAALVAACFLGAATCDCVWIGAVVLVPGVADELPLLEISTAMIATMPMPAAPMPANKKVRDPLPRGGDICLASFS